MAEYVCINKETLIHKSIKEFRVPQCLEQFDYVDRLFFDLNIDNATAVNLIFHAFQMNRNVINLLPKKDTQYTKLESRKSYFNIFMSAHGFSPHFPIIYNTFCGSINSAIAQDNLEIVKENFALDLIRMNEHLGPHFFDVACKFGSMKCYRFLKMNGVKCTENSAKYSIASGNPEMVMDFYNNGYDLSNFFQYAINCRQYDIADWLLDNYSEVYISVSECLKEGNLRGACFCLENKIHFSVENFHEFYHDIEDKSTLDYLLDNSPEELIDEIYVKSLIDADFNVLAALAERGYNMNRIVEYRWKNNCKQICPLLAAAFHCNDELYQFFIDHGADENLELVNNRYSIIDCKNNTFRYKLFKLDLCVCCNTTARMIGCFIIFAMLTTLFVCIGIYH